MKQMFLSCLAAVVMSLVLGCAPQGDREAEMLAAAKDLDQRFIAALSSGDVDAVMATYWNSPDLVSYPIGVLETRGWDATKEDIAQAFDNMPETAFELTETNYMVAGDVVIGWGKWVAKVPLPGGQELTVIGRYTDVKAIRDGKWVYILDHASAPLPPAPDLG